MARLIRKSGFKLRDEVYFDDFEKQGTIIALSPDKLKIFSNKSTLFRHPQVVYKKSETLGCGHWDTLTKTKKTELLSKYNVSKDLPRRDWQDIPGAIKNKKNVVPQRSPGNSIASASLSCLSPKVSPQSVLPKRRL